MVVLVHGLTWQQICEQVRGDTPLIEGDPDCDKCPHNHTVGVRAPKGYTFPITFCPVLHLNG